ncbi:hypothetical protein J6590_086899 [Homalodisca vitripennis]|nr:hypothetical protein J6590_086899 [Homalodisca vitripennis]
MCLCLDGVPKSTRKQNSHTKHCAEAKQFPYSWSSRLLFRWLTSSSRCFCGNLPVLIGSSVQVSRYLELGFLRSSLQASVGRGRLRVLVVGVLKSKLAARSLDEPARCFGVNIVGPTFQKTFHDLI